jgi:hypothetical protein
MIREASKPSDDASQIQERVDQLKQQLQQPSVSEDLRKSLSAQIEILQQRQEKEARGCGETGIPGCGTHADSRTGELLREQAVLSTDPEAVSERIDQVTTTLGGTNQWIRDQQKIYGAMEDLLADPPRIACRKLEGIGMTNQLPAWAEQMRDLSDPAPSRSFLIHGNIFDVVGIGRCPGGRCCR